MDYNELLSNIDFVSYIAAFAKWTFLFLIISIFILIMGTKFKLFKRLTKFADTIVKAYYILIPAYFIIFAFKFAPIKNTQIQINRAIDKNKAPATDFAYDFLSSIVSDSILAQKSSMKDIVNTYLDKYEFEQDLLTDSKELKYGKKFLYKIKRKIEFAFLSRIIESGIVKEITDFLGINEKTGQTLYRTDFNELFKEGEIIELFKMELNNVFGKIYNTMFLIFGIGLLFPIIEIGLSKIIKY